MNKITAEIDVRGRIWHNGMRYFSESEINSGQEDDTKNQRVCGIDGGECDFRYRRYVSWSGMGDIVVERSECKHSSEIRKEYPTHLKHCEMAVKTKKILLNVSRCRECVYLTVNKTVNNNCSMVKDEWACAKHGRDVIPQINEIPEWCPLPDTT